MKIGTILNTIGSALTGAMIAAVLAMIVVVIVRSSNPLNEPFFEEEDYIVRLLTGAAVGAVLGFIVGAIVTVLRARPLYAALLGMLCGIVPVALLAGLSTAAEGLSFPRSELRIILLMTGIFCFLGGAAGLVCGVLNSVLIKNNKMGTPEHDAPPPPDFFNIN